MKRLRSLLAPRTWLSLAGVASSVIACSPAPEPSHPAPLPTASAVVPTVRPGPTGPTPPPHVARKTGTPSDNELVIGDEAFAKQDYPTALLHYEQARALAPRDPAPIVGVVRAKLAIADVPEGVGAAPENPHLVLAIDTLKQAMSLDMDYGPCLVDLARALLVSGQVETALGLAEAGTRALPDDPEAWSTFGVANLANGRKPEAVVALQKAADLGPFDAPRQENLGTALLASSRPAEASVAFEKAIRLAPTSATAHNGLGTAWLAQGKPDTATPYLEKAVELDPTRAGYKQNLGYAWHLRGQHDKAIALYEEALRTDDHLVSAWVNLGNARAQLGKLPEACDAYKKVYAIDPTDPRLKEALLDLDLLARQKGAATCVVTPKH